MRLVASHQSFINNLSSENNTALEANTFLNAPKLPKLKCGKSIFKRKTLNYCTFFVLRCGEVYAEREVFQGANFKKKSGIKCLFASPKSDQKEVVSNKTCYASAAYSPEY